MSQSRHNVQFPTRPHHNSTLNWHLINSDSFRNCLSNFWELSVQSKIVYRYDVAVYLGNRANSRAVNYLRGPRDDYAQVTRRRVCLCALQLILARYHIASEGSAVIYDGSAIMFSSEDLAPALKEHHGILTINTGDLPVQLSKQIRFYCPSGDTLTIEICRCRDDATSFDIADLSAQVRVYKVVKGLELFDGQFIFSM
ncbi:hypothetical protein OSTOST_21568 [Ostertagia ostertagi]